MVVGITSRSEDMEYNGKIVRFDGELLINGFMAIASTMEWLPPNDGDEVTDDERITLIKAVRKDCRWRRFKVIFADDEGKPLRRRIT
jgi:hypothetical protein